MFRELTNKLSRKMDRGKAQLLAFMIICLLLTGIGTIFSVLISLALN